MPKTSVTVRIDSELKTKVDEACLYFDSTITSLVNQKFRSYVDEYYKHRANENRTARLIAEGDNYQFMFDAAKREAYILNKLGFDNFLNLAESRDSLRYEQFYNFLLEKVCNDLGIDYLDITKRLKGEKML